MDEDLDADANQREEDEKLVIDKLVNEEYKIWKKNAPFLYDLILSSALEWPTLTTQWFPDMQSYSEQGYSTHRLLIGTHTSGNDTNYLQIAEVNIPDPPSEQDPRKYDEDKGEIGGYAGGSECRLAVTQKIVHTGEVNKARYLPQKPDLIATMCYNGDVLIFDRTKHPLQPANTQNCAPQATLSGHKQEGYGLAWSPFKEGTLLTGAEDATVLLWDTKSNYSKNNTTLSPTTAYTYHTAIVNDVAWHPTHEYIFGSVSDDRTLQIVDIRHGDPSKAAHKVTAHSDAVNAIAFNGESEYVVATASADKTVALWDLRNIKYKLHSLSGHMQEVNGLSWHPTEESVLASSGSDRRIIFWDLSRIGEEQSPEDAEDGPPELLFMHGGHTNRISDFAWNPIDPWVMCSAAEDNLIQVWKVSSTIVGKDTDEVTSNELE